MLPAPCPTDEAIRQQALDDLELLDTPAELYLDTLVRLTRELFQVETVLISLIDRDRQWFKARIGLDVAETPRDISFCGHAVAARSPLVVEDTHQDPRFSDNPLVTGAPFIRFYAGQPLYSPSEQPIGTLCLLHPQPRSLDTNERLRLRDLATLVEGYLHLRTISQHAHRLRQAVSREQRKALIDPLTQLWNRAGLKQLAGQFDFILVTVNVALDWPLFTAALAPKGRLHFVGGVLEPIPVAAFSLIGGQKSLGGSPLGSPAVTAKMLDFCARHAISPQVEEFPMAEVNAALEHLRAGKARYRVVLKAAS